MPPTTTLVISVMTVGYLVFLKMLLDRQIITVRPLVVFGLASGAAFLEFFFLISQTIPSQVVLWLFDLDKEKNIPSTYSSVLLLLVGIVCLWIGIRLAAGRLDWRIRLYWFWFGALFTFLAFDEYYFIHERFIYWHEAYAVIGGLSVVFTALIAWFFDRPHLTVYALIFLGMISLGIGGVGFDFAGTPIPFGYIFRYTVEEYLEYIGITVILFASMTYLKQVLDSGAWRLAVRVLPAAVAVWILGSLFWTFWPLSWLEVQTSAEQVTIDFLDGDFSLIAFQVQDMDPGSGQFMVAEYWRANAPLYGTYAHALKLLDPITHTLVSQSNIGMQPRIPPTEGWIPGLIYKKEAYVSLDDVAPGDYLLAVQVWVEPAAVEMLPITHTDQPLVQPDIVVLKRLTIQPA